MAVTLMFNVPEAPDIEKINIYESTTEDGTYSLVEQGDFSNYPYYSNYYIYQLGDLANYYKVSFTDNSGIEGNKSRADNYMKPGILDCRIMGMRYMMAERMRRDLIVLDRNGEYANMYLKKTTGERCSCFNESIGQTNSNCTDCYGTGFIGGYDLVVNTKVKLSFGVTRKMALTDGGLLMDTRPFGWIPPDFPVQNGDIIHRRKSDKRYRVTDVKGKEVTGIITRYEFNLVEPDKNDPIYKIGT